MSQTPDFDTAAVQVRIDRRAKAIDGADERLGILLAHSHQYALDRLNNTFHEALYDGTNPGTCQERLEAYGTFASMVFRKDAHANRPPLAVLQQ
jgi:hypothetical protein